MDKERDLEPEVDGFEEHVGTLTLRDQGVNGQTAKVEFEIPVERDTGAFAHDSFVEDLESLISNHYEA